MKSTLPAAGPAVPQRNAPATPGTQRPPPRVLQTSRSPAQLSLFLRPSGR